MRKVYMTTVGCIALVGILFCLQILGAFEDFDLLYTLTSSATLFIPILLIARSAYLVINCQHELLSSISIFCAVACIIFGLAGIFDFFDPGEFLNITNGLCTYLLGLNFIFEVKAIENFHRKFQYAMAIFLTIIFGLYALSSFSPELIFDLLMNEGLVKLLSIGLIFEICGFFINPMIGAIVNDLLENPYAVSKKRRVDFVTTTTSSTPAFVPVQQPVTQSVQPQPIMQQPVQPEMVQPMFQPQMVENTNNMTQPMVNSAIPTPGAPIIPNRIEEATKAEAEIPTIIQ